MMEGPQVDAIPPWHERSHQCDVVVNFILSQFCVICLGGCLKWW